MVAWYFQHVYGHWEGPGQLPFYCDPRRVGHFAVAPAELSAGSEAGLFRLFVGLAMYQARRDVVIMAQQLQFTATQVRTLAATSSLRRRLQASRCSLLQDADQLDQLCSVRKGPGGVTCQHHPRASCVVKDSSDLFNRMADMGKLPASAYLRLGRSGGLPRLVEQVMPSHAEPARRAEVLVEELGRVYRVGRKLATMYVSALSTPALAPGLTPWNPEVDGNSLMVIDTHVARAVDVLARTARTYAARSAWLEQVAQRLDLRLFRAELPAVSPRLVQQAIYQFCSGSNRRAHGEPCSSVVCENCVPQLCPAVSGRPVQ